MPAERLEERVAPSQPGAWEPRLHRTRCQGVICGRRWKTVWRLGALFLALASTCLDQVDFGVPQTSSASLGGNAAKYLMRRNELKDGKKRFNSNKIHGEEAADAARASLALAAKLADRQPTLARIVTRAQHIRNEAMYQRVESRDVPTSKRIRSRGE